MNQIMSTSISSNNYNNKNNNDDKGSTAKQRLTALEMEPLVVPPSPAGHGERSSFTVTRMKKFHLCLWLTAISIVITVSQKRNLYQPLEKIQNKTETIDTLLENDDNNNNNIISKNNAKPTTTIKTTFAPTSLPTVSPTKLPPTNNYSDDNDNDSDEDDNNDKQNKPIDSSTFQNIPNDSTDVLSDFSEKFASSSLSSTTKTTTINNMDGFSTNKPPNATAGAAFVEQFCDLGQSTDWYPTNDLQWQQRAPYFLIPGAKMCGTTSLYEALLDHPQLLRPREKEFGYFLPSHFSKFTSRTDDNKVKVFEARERLYAVAYDMTSLKAPNSTFVSFDASTGYMFYSNEVPRNILCVAPWVKLIIILRNPIDRVYATYDYARRNTQLRLSFDNWIAQEFHIMAKVGLIPMPTNITAEDAAWSEYLRIQDTMAPIGRSLYVIQLRQWFQAFQDIGKDPRKEIFIFQTQDMSKRPKQIYNQILNFLHLDPSYSKDEIPHLSRSQNSFEMSNKTRDLLTNFFKPYNQRLYKLLGNDFGGNWQGIWD